MGNYKNERADLAYKALTNDLSSFPFSFVYDGEKFEGFSKSFFTLKDKKTTVNGEKESTQYLFSFKQLEITLLLTHYYDYGATEWTVWFENVSKENSGVISSIQTQIIFKGSRPTLKGILGDHVNQYRPYANDLTKNTLCFSSDTCRATHINFPYFNLEYGDGGAMLAIGWGGTWNARFSSDGENTVYTAQSVNELNTYLKPNEKIRTALFAVANYTKRNEHFATNYWRSWYMTHNAPKQDASGAQIQPFSTSCLSSDAGRTATDGSMNECYWTWKPSLEKMIAEDVKVDFRWFDAGWYVRPDKTSPGLGLTPDTNWWATIGTWVLDPEKWPGETFLESTEFARANGMKTLMWFEPERVTDPENLEKNFGYNKEWAIKLGKNGGCIANNIGNPDCFQWTLNQICTTLRNNKVEMYREDNNMDIVSLCKKADGDEGENRQGITESKLIDAHYRLWDEIIQCTLSYGGCGFVDSCASGGGRNDLESMRRGVPLLRSDADRTTSGLRLSMTTAFNKWIPFCGACAGEKKAELAVQSTFDTYSWRASYLPSPNVSAQYTQDPNLDFDMLRFGLREWDKVKPYLLKDFYTHTSWHTEHDLYDFTAFSYFDPEKEKGVLFCFRQENCVPDTVVLSLPYAEEEKVYLLTDEDTGEKTEYSGLQLIHGIALRLENPRSSRLIWVEKI